MRIDCESLSELFLAGDNASADELGVLIFVFGCLVEYEFRDVEFLGVVF